ncbi:hypothetical protein [Chryseobacterium indoltheticum]
MRIAFSPGSQYIWAIAEYASSGQGFQENMFRNLIKLQEQRPVYG